MESRKLENKIEYGDVDITVDHNKKLIIRKAKGILTEEVLLKTVREIKEVPGFNPDYNILWELSEANFSENIKYNEIKRIKSEADRIFSALKRKDCKVAFYTGEGQDRDCTFGLAMQYEAANAADSHLYKIQVFRDIEKALNWLEEE